jgi:hypothetical protein
VRDAAQQIDTEPVVDIQRDFFGDPLPTQRVMVGPFQRLTHRKNTLPLWPPAGPSLNSPNCDVTSIGCVLGQHRFSIYSLRRGLADFSLAC